MESLNLWIRNIAVYYIITSAIINMIPEERYAKYIRFFLSILLILLLLDPVFQWTKTEPQLDLSAYVKQTSMEIGMPGDQMQ